MLVKTGPVHSFEPSVRGALRRLSIQLLGKEFYIETMVLSPCMGGSPCRSITFTGKVWAGNRERTFQLLFPVVTAVPWIGYEFGGSARAAFFGLSSKFAELGGIPFTVHMVGMGPVSPVRGVCETIQRLVTFIGDFGLMRRGSWQYKAEVPVWVDGFLVDQEGQRRPSWDCGAARLSLL